MKNTDNSNLNTFLFIGFIFFLCLLVFRLGMSVRPLKTVTVQVPFSDKLAQCEADGGRYHLYWSNLYKKYEDGCKVEEKYLW